MMEMAVVVLVHKWYMHPETKSQNAFPVIISTPAIMPVYFIVTTFFDRGELTNFNNYSLSMTIKLCFDCTKRLIWICNF